MKLMQNNRFQSLEDAAREYAENRVDALVQEGNWNNDRYPDISRLFERMGDLMDALLDETGESDSVSTFSATAMLYAKALAKEAYMLGILDGGRIQHEFLSRDLPANE